MGKKKIFDYDTDFNLKMEDTKLSKKALKMFANDPEVSGRYHAFKDSKVDKTKLKNYVFNKYDITISENSSVIVATSCKIFLGEIVEKARELMSKDKLKGPIPPKYYKIAYKIVTENFKGPIFQDNPFLSQQF